MKWSTVTVGIMMLGIIGISIILLFQNITTTNENDYYLLKEITEAAMIDSIDLTHYRETGELKIVREKFVENFTRRFSESTLIIGSKYTINFYDIMESPPKVSIIINTGIDNYRIYNTSSDYTVLNNLTGIFEYVGQGNGESTSESGSIENPSITKELTKTYYAIIKKGLSSYNDTLTLNIPDELISGKIKNVTLVSADYDSTTIDIKQPEVNMALLQRDIYYSDAYSDYDGIIDYILSIDKVTNMVYNNDSITLVGSNTISITGTDNGLSDLEKAKEYGIIKFTVTWEYDEYAYNLG